MSTIYNSLSFDSEGSERRSTGRRLVEFLDSNLGPVLDLSGGGARVRSANPLHGLQTLRFRHEGGIIEVIGRVAWCQVAKWGRHTAGIEFMEVPADVRGRLAVLSTAHARGQIRPT